MAAPDVIIVGGGVIGCAIAYYLAQAGVQVTIPILAVGGISAENVGEVMQAGARGAAVISTILGAPSPAAAARRLAEAMVEAAAVPARRTRA